jgi:hypothetical protein
LHVCHLPGTAFARSHFDHPLDPFITVANRNTFVDARRAIMCPLALEKIENKVRGFCLASRALGSLG